MSVLHSTRGGFIWLLFVSLDRADDVVANHIGIKQRSTDKLVDRLIDELFDQAIRTPPVGHADLHELTLGSPGQMLVPVCKKIFCSSRRFLGTYLNSTGIRFG